MSTNHRPNSGDRVHAEAESDPADLVPTHPAAFLPARLLEPGELIILLIKPSPWYIILASLGVLIPIAVTTTVAYRLAGAYAWNVSQRDILLVGFGLAGITLFWQFLEWLSRVYVLTDRRVIRVMGVLRVHVFEAGLKQVQHTQCYFSIRERLFGLGTIGFATAGTGAIEAAWVMVAKPLDVHQTILRTINRYRR
jgi:hypothetical protein